MTPESTAERQKNVMIFRSLRRQLARGPAIAAGGPELGPGPKLSTNSALSLIGMPSFRQSNFMMIALWIALVFVMIPDTCASSKRRSIKGQHTKRHAENTSESLEDLLNAVVDDEADTSGVAIKTSDENVGEDDDDDENDSDDDDIEDDDDELHLRYEFAIEEFHDADTNKDNKIDYKEFLAHKEDLTESEANNSAKYSEFKEKHKPEFASYDKNKDGVVGLNEVSLVSILTECTVGLQDTHARRNTDVDTPDGNRSAS